MRLTCQYRFAASHRLDTPELTPEANQELYGKCNNPYGHGHDYSLHVTVEGPMDSSGQIVERDKLHRLVQEQVLAPLDHKSLNQDVPYFADAVPTTENLASWVHSRLAEHWTLAPRLAHIRISETPRNTFDLEIPA